MTLEELRDLYEAYLMNPEPWKSEMTLIKNPSLDSLKKLAIEIKRIEQIIHHDQRPTDL